MTDSEELARLKEELIKLTNLLPNDPVNMPSGTPELVHAYKAGYINGFIAYRQTIKKIIFPQGGT